MILDRILTKLGKTTTAPRTALNCLNLIDFLLKNGSSKFKNEVEEERYLLRKYLSYYNEDQEELNSPIINSAQRILELLDNPEKLKEKREEARKMKERIQGFSNEVEAGRDDYFHDNKYGGFSSEDYSKGYDSRPEIDLNKKFGITSNASEEKTRTEPSKETIKKDAEIDLLGDDEPSKPTTKTDAKTGIFGEKKPRKFLPPPPKKNKDAEPKFASEETTNNKLADDLMDLDVGSKKNTAGRQQNNKDTKEGPKHDDLDFDIVGGKTTSEPNSKNTGDLDMLDFTAPQPNAPVNNTKDKEVDLFDLTDVKESEAGDNYMDLLTGKSGRLGKPPKKPDSNYDFL